MKTEDVELMLAESQRLCPKLWKDGSNKRKKKEVVFVPKGPLRFNSRAPHSDTDMTKCVIK